MADHSPADCAGLRCACHRPHPFDLPLLGVEMKRSLWIGISLILAAIICLSFLRPHEMVSPGNLIPAHSTLQNNCFACHAPFQGASAERRPRSHVVSVTGRPEWAREGKGGVML